MAKDTLSIQQQRFVDNILMGMNQTDAYLNAGYKATPKSAESKAARLVRVGKIKDVISAGREKASEAVQITQERILQEESRLAFYDPKELMDESGKLIPINQLPENIRRAIHGFEIIHTTLGDVKYKYKFAEKGKSLERLEKIGGMFAPERHDHTLTIEEVIKNIGNRS